MGKKRRSFSREFKQEAVRLVVEEDRTLRAVAEELGIGAGLLGRWKRELEADSEQAFPGNGSLKERDKELDRLRREVTRLKAENTFLKRVSSYFAKGPK